VRIAYSAAAPASNQFPRPLGLGALRALSTDLFREEPVKPEHQSPHVQLLGFRAMNRVCEVRFNPADPASALAGFLSIAPGR
jgi:hypothetical protein